MGLIFIIGFILWGWVEITAFIAIGGEVGVLLTIIGVFVTAVVGISLLKSQGRSVMVNLQAQVSRGEAPLKSVADSLALLAGGVLMLIPGYVTDAIGLLLFIPGIRTAAGLLFLTRLRSNNRFSQFTQANAGWTPPQRESTPEDDVIEGEYEEKAKPEAESGGHSRTESGTKLPPQ